MGCGGSKLDHENDANNNIRPIFHTRLEEFIARRYGGNNCKKQIIASNNNNVNVHNETSSIMQEEDVLTPPSLPLPLPSPPPPPPHPTISMDDNNGLMFQQTQDFPPSLQIVSPNFDNNCDHSNVSSTNQVLKDDNISHNNNNNDVDDNVDVDDKGQNLGEIKVSKDSLEDGEMEYFDDLVGSSPSFRVYCIQSVLVDDELDEIAELHSKELLEEDEKDCLSQESSNSNEVVEEKEVLKKHKRGIMKLRMITIPKVALGKSIMHNMHSLYPFSSGSNNHHSQQHVQPQTA